MSDTHLNDLIDSNLSTLQAAADLLTDLSIDEFAKIHSPWFDSSPGKHMRHVLDHYLCFRRDLPGGLIDYNRRQRDCRLESDKEHALHVVLRLCRFLADIKQNNRAEQPVSVLVCSDAALPAGNITQSSLGRELQFLQGHSVHHYAMIAAMLRFLGNPPDPQFGVAPSTIVHEETVCEETTKESA